MVLEGRTCLFRRNCGEVILEWIPSLRSQGIILELIQKVFHWKFLKVWFLVAKIAEAPWCSKIGPLVDALAWPWTSPKLSSSEDGYGKAKGGDLIKINRILMKGNELVSGEAWKRIPHGTTWLDSRLKAGNLQLHGKTCSRFLNPPLTTENICWLAKPADSVAALGVCNFSPRQLTELLAYCSANNLPRLRSLQ